MTPCDFFHLPTFFFNTEFSAVATEAAASGSIFCTQVTVLNEWLCINFHPLHFYNFAYTWFSSRCTFFFHLAFLIFFVRCVPVESLNLCIQHPHQSMTLSPSLEQHCLASRNIQPWMLQTLSKFIVGIRVSEIVREREKSKTIIKWNEAPEWINRVAKHRWKIKPKEEIEEREKEKKVILCVFITTCLVWMSARNIEPKPNEEECCASTCTE